MCLQTIGGLLGHSDLSTIEGYAHLETKSVGAASLRMGRYFEKIALGQKTSAKRVRKPVACKYRIFLNSKETRAQYCAARGYDEDLFADGLRKWRMQNAQVVSC